MWKTRDPMIRMRDHLKSLDLWNDSKEAAASEKAETLVAEAVKRAEEIAEQPVSEIFDSMYNTIDDPEMIRQRQTMRTSSIGQDPTQVESTEQVN